MLGEEGNLAEEGALFSFLENDDVEKLTKEFENGLDVNQQFFWYLGDLPPLLTNSPPLISVAAFFKAVKCYHSLVDNGADIEKCDEQGVPVAWFAIAGGSMEIIEDLDNRGIDFNRTLQVAAEYGHHEVFVWLHEKKSFDLGEKDEYGRTFLHIAAASGNTDLVQFLIEHGLDVNEIDGVCLWLRLSLDVLWSLLFVYWTPIHFAVEKRQHAVVRLLLEQPRINANCKDFVFESKKLMWHEFGNCMPLHHAVHNGDLEMVNLLLESPKVDPNCKDVDGRTPLQLAAMSGNKEIVSAILKRPGIDVLSKGHDGVFHFLIELPLISQKTVKYATCFLVMGQDMDVSFYKPLSVLTNKSFNHYIFYRVS